MSLLKILANKYKNCKIKLDCKVVSCYSINRNKNQYPMIKYCLHNKFKKPQNN
jgi:hypothetical protein